MLNLNKGLFFSVFFIFCTIIFTPLHAQTSESLVVDVDSQLIYSQQPNIISTIVRLKNNTTEEFHGYLSLILPEGIKNISGDNISLTIRPSDSIFVPVKLLVRTETRAGTSTVGFQLSDDAKRTLEYREASINVSEKVQLNLVADNNNIFVTNYNDSIQVSATVNNLGNKVQDVTVVFRIPDVLGEPVFIERKATIQPMKSAPFVFRFLSTKQLLEKEQFVVNISAMKGRGEELFGSTIVTVKNVSSKRQFHETENYLNDNLYQQDNSITASYRSVGNVSDVYQVRGGSSLNLPAGFLEFRGNVYKTNSNKEFVVTNTALSYKLHQNEFTFGNMNESLEMTMYGRGAKISLADKNRDKDLQIGIIDGEYNLFSPVRLFSNIYNVYAVGRIGNINKKKSFGANYVFRNDPMQGVKHNMIGGEVNWMPDGKWFFNLKVHGAFSLYDVLNESKLSASSELLYVGRWDNYTLNGSYYFSTAYFPGNKRGTLSMQQNFGKIFKNKYQLKANLSYSDYSPKYYHSLSDYHNRNFRGDAALYFPTWKTFATNVSYQNQYELSNAYIYYFPMIASDISMSSNRLVEQVGWSSSNLKHLIFVGIENGLVKYPVKDDYDFQFKTNVSYSYKWFNLMSSYQYGSYYISEYVLANSKNVPFERFLASASANNNFFDNKFILNSGISLSKDIYSGTNPSMFMNLKYNPSDKYSFFLNSSWYQYSYGGTSKRDFYNIEAGITVNFSKKIVSSKLKSKIVAFVFYDKNANGVFDDADEPAPDYDIIINNTAFITNTRGEITYSLVPFGSYDISPVSKKGWFYMGNTIVVNKFKTKVDIPLRQAGTISGKVVYVYDKNRVVDFVPKYGGISFRITDQDKKSIQRVITNGDGYFTTFLPTGNYQIEVIQNSLETNTTCSNPVQSFSVESGKIINLPHFQITVKLRKVNVKQFSQ